MTDFLNRLMQRHATFPMRPVVNDHSPPELSILDRPHAPELANTPDGDGWSEFQDRLLTHKLRLVEASGLFDEAYYLAAYPDVAGADITPLQHFFGYGFKEGRRPNPYFEPVWYLGRYPEVLEQAIQPLLDFVLHGEKQGRWPCPLFDPVWYRERYAVPTNENSLTHYLVNRTTQPLSPIKEFDADFYAQQNPDLVAAKVDLFEHFLNQGYRECRDPSPEFDVKFYTQRYLRHLPGEHPFLHFLNHRHEPGIAGRLPDSEATVPREIRRFTKAGELFEEFKPLPLGASRRFKLLAYHLPQFHAFSENDAWWGQGFTEWTNIARGVPRFKGHYQPRVPRDLGFYNLDSDASLRKQVELAQAGGVYGFVFYYYWFNGRRLMEKPVERFLEDRSIDMPFALMWANENWTRRWDGSEDEVLISQDYRQEDDEILAASFAAHFRDPRYIRCQGRPLLMLYRPGIIPDLAQKITRWRAIFRTEHGEDPIMVTAQAFNVVDPRDIGLDGAIEFPPHKLTSALPPANVGFEYLDPDFKGKIYHYDDVVKVSLDERPPPFPLIKTAVPSWDNDARRQGNGIVVTGSTPHKYEAWLTRLGDQAEAHPFFGERLVCVNAWNEWCEGAYLEPDLHFGAAYLNATARAVSGRTAQGTGPRILLIGHDAFPSGAQHLLLNIGRTLRRAFGAACEFLLLDSGQMVAEYEKIAPVSVVTSDEQLAARLRSLAERGFAGAIVNTTAAARAVPYCRAAAIDPVLLVHELPRIVREKHLGDAARKAFQDAKHIIFAAPFVRDEMLRSLEIDAVEVAQRTLIMPQGSYKDVTFQAEAALALRQELGLPKRGDRLVLGVGYADLRKGFDLFVQLWRLLQADKRPGRICLAWVGAIDPGLKAWLGDEIADAEAAGTFRMLGYRDDMETVFSAADAFVLTSREDPFPTVVMEALSAGVPVYAFERAGGIPDMLRETQAGTVLPYCDVNAMAQAVSAGLARSITPAERDARHKLIRDRFDFQTYAAQLMRVVLPALPRISVVVPNYNYARYMQDRLGAIFRQSQPVHEILVLDDCSTDDSLQVIPAVAEAADRIIRVVPNVQNSGSVFAQWRKAAELASGDLLWIAEADDLSDADFLLRATALLAHDPAVVLAFTDSRTIDVDGAPQWDSYKGYYGTVEPGALARTEIFEAADFVQRFLATKNLILNVSAVVWRRTALLAALDACQAELREYRMAGDWRLYLQALALPGARIGYEAAPLNVHRRHAQSVTHALDADRHVAEIARCHAAARKAATLPDSALEAQAAYLQEVSAQLGATGSGGGAAPAADRRAPVGDQAALAKRPGGAGQPSKTKPGFHPQAARGSSTKAAHTPIRNNSAKPFKGKR
jgi:glycosyltransferase involved in cell wall biosynthesis